MNLVSVAKYDELPDRDPQYALVGTVDLVVVRFDERVSVMYGRCLHRGALMSDGFVRGDDLICGVHDWDYRLDGGVSAYNNKEALPVFKSWVEDGNVVVDEDEINEWGMKHPQPFNRDSYLGLYADTEHGNAEEPHTGLIQHYAKNGLTKTGHHGKVDAMGVPRDELPLARGAELAGTGICSGEGGMLPEEQEANSRYFYELASSKFGFSWDKLDKVQAFHFKGGQGAKTGTGGHLPGNKVHGKIAEVRGLNPGDDAISPPRFPEWTEPSQIKEFADEVRDRTGGIPIGYKLSAQHIEKDIDAALEVGVDYIILDGRGGGTGAAPIIFRDNISVPTIPALARARRHLDNLGRQDVTLVITGGLRKPADFIKALALGADAIALSNSAMQAIGCIAMRACHTNN